jgi:hypothetical protein
MDASWIHPAYNMYGETGDRNRKEEEELALEDKQNEGFPQLVPRLFSIEHSMSRTSRCGKQHGREAVEMEVERCRDVRPGLSKARPFRVGESSPQTAILLSSIVWLASSSSRIRSEYRTDPFRFKLLPCVGTPMMASSLSSTS